MNYVDEALQYSLVLNACSEKLKKKIKGRIYENELKVESKNLVRLL
jgi:hypothetical protein